MVRPWGKDGPRIALVSNAIKTTYVSLQDTKKATTTLKRYLFEADDSYLAETTHADPKYFGSVERLIGKHTIHCMISVRGAEHDLIVARGLLELCETMAPTEPPAPDVKTAQATP